MSILEANIPVQHQVWTDSTERDSHGNKVGSYAPPVERKVIGIWPASASVSRSDVVNPNVVARTETDVMLDVDNPSIYGAKDLVIIDGFKFKVQAQPQFSNWDNMPIAGYADLVPGQVHVKRVT